MHRPGPMGSWGTSSVFALIENPRFLVLVEQPPHDDEIARRCSHCFVPCDPVTGRHLDHGSEYNAILSRRGGDSHRYHAADHGPGMVNERLTPGIRCAVAFASPAASTTTAMRHDPVLQRPERGCRGRSLRPIRSRPHVRRSLSQHHAVQMRRGQSSARQECHPNYPSYPAGLRARLRRRSRRRVWVIADNRTIPKTSV